MAIDPGQKELWLQEFQLNGFIVLRDFLPLDYVDALREQLSPLMLGEYEKAQGDEFSRGRGAGRLAIHLDQYAKLLGGPLDDDRYRRHPVIDELVDAIMGQGSWKRGWTLVEAAWKGSRHMAWHSDQKLDDTPDLDAEHEPIRVTYNIPLTEFSAVNGATEFIPGSHRLPRSATRDLPILSIPHVFPVLLGLRKGDAVLRDGNGLHRGTPNLSDEPRFMLDQTYKKL